MAELDSIEKNHLRDIDLQKTEVIKYWLHNSPDASWTTLANAVERMGGHARLVETLREKEQTITNSDSEESESSEDDNKSSVLPFFSPSTRRKMRRISMTVFYTPHVSSEVCLAACLHRNILILDKMCHDKSALVK